MDVETTEQVKESHTPSPPPLPAAEDRGTTDEVDASAPHPPAAAATGKQRSLERGSPNSSLVKRNGSLQRGDAHGGGRKGSLRRDQRTGEKRRSRTGSLGSLVGYEAKFPVSECVPQPPVFYWVCGARQQLSLWP